MPTYGHKDTILSGCTLYDDGGPNGNYSSRCEATYTFHTANSENYYRIRLDYFEMPHEPGYSLLEIYNGDSTQMTAANRIFSSADYYWYSWRRFYFSRDSVITIRFQADDDAPTSGWWVELCEAGGATAQNVDYEMLDSTTAKITWDEPDINIHWILQYCYSTSDNPEEAMMDTNNVFTTLYVDTNFVIISGLHFGQSVLFSLFTESSAPCHGGGVWVICPCVAPQDFHVNYDSDSMRVTWRYDPNVAFWNISGYAPTGFDTVLPGTDTSWAVPYQCTDVVSYYVEIEGNCQFQVMRCSYNWMNPQPVQCSNVNMVLRQGITGNSIAFTWDGLVDTAMGYITAYRDLRWPTDSIAILDTIFDEPYADTIYGLEPNTNYEVWVYTLCDWGIRSCGNHTTFATSLDNCIDYVNIWDLDKTRLTWGYYDNIDSVKHFSNYDWYGEGNIYFWGSDRHQPFTDTTQYDSRTNGALRCVPPGDKASLRLGNDNVNREAESITYDYFVDSTDKDMLVLKYAIVMQNPNHTPENQPHFTMEILDSTGNIIDSACCYADFYAADNMVGWDSVPGTNIIFKDWTTVGIDIAPYHGQTIKVRLINKDCAEGGHFAYSYFTMHCDNKRIYLLNKCDAADSIHLQAPIGFDYRWTRKGDATVIGTNYDLLVPVDSNEYQCLCSFIGKPECNFTINTYSVNIYPRAKMTYYVDTCGQMAYFIDSSFLEIGAGSGVFTKQFIDSSFWRINGDSIAFGDTLRLELTENRVYEVADVSTLSGSVCRDSAVVQINARFVYDRRIGGDSLLCLGDSTHLTANLFPHADFAYQWNTGDTDSSITVMPESGRSLYYVIYDDGRCHDTIFKQVDVFDNANDTIYAVGCVGFVFDSLGFHENKTGIYTFRKLNKAGCDSLSTLNLHIKPIYNDTFYVSVCDETYSGLGFHADSSGFYTRRLHTAEGCDSTVNLLLERRTVSVWGDTSACEGDSVHLSASQVQEDWARYLWNTGLEGTNVTIVARRGDEAYKLQVVVNDTCRYNIQHPVAVHPLYDDTLRATICGDFLDTLDFHEIETGIYTHFLQSQYGCDSLQSLSLVRQPVYDDTMRVETCDQPFNNLGFDVDSTGIYEQKLVSRYGCDSIVRLVFTRNSVFVDTVKAEIYYGDKYVAHGFEETEEGIYVNVFSDSNNCDSTYVLDLSVVAFLFPNSVTPNGDGINDVFEIYDQIRANMFDYTCLWIYDRTGRLIFKKENINKKDECWDPNDTNSPTDTYFYHFQARSLGKSYEHNGIIEVMR